MSPALRRARVASLRAFLLRHHEPLCLPCWAGLAGRQARGAITRARGSLPGDGVCPGSPRLLQDQPCLSLLDLLAPRLSSLSPKPRASQDPGVSPPADSPAVLMPTCTHACPHICHTHAVHLNIHVHTRAHTHTRLVTCRLVASTAVASEKSQSQNWREQTGRNRPRRGRDRGSPLAW